MTSGTPSNHRHRDRQRQSDAGTDHASIQTMTTLRLVTPSGHQEPHKPHARAVALAVVAALVALLLLGIWAWHLGAQSRALRHLPAEERRVLFERTLHTLQAPCTPEKRNGLDDFCREQAEFVLQFPECDKACAVLARQYLNAPAK